MDRPVLHITNTARPRLRAPPSPTQFARAHGDARVTAMSFDASMRRLITGAEDGTVHMWNFNNGQPLHEFTGGGGTGVRRDVWITGSAPAVAVLICKTCVTV